MRAHKSIKEMIRLVPMGTILRIFPALGEEIGWRGLALLKLQEKHTALIASVIIRRIGDCGICQWTTLQWDNMNSSLSQFLY